MTDDRSILIKRYHLSVLIRTTELSRFAINIKNIELFSENEKKKKLFKFIYSISKYLIRLRINLKTFDEGG